MSVKQMGLVWEYDLPHNEAWVLMALVDHGDHDGRNIRPGIDLIAWKTGYERRQVQRIVKRLVEKRYLEETRPAKQRRPAEYRVCPDRIPRKPARDDKMSPLEIQGRQNVTPETPRDDKMSPQQGRQNVTPETPRDDIAMSPDPSCVVVESHDQTSTTTTTPAREQSPGGGGSVVHTESYNLLKQIGVRASICRELAGHPPERIRAAIASGQGRARSLPSWVVSGLREIDPAADPAAVAAAVAAEGAEDERRPDRPARGRADRPVRLQSDAGPPDRREGGAGRGRAGGGGAAHADPPGGLAPPISDEEFEQRRAAARQKARELQSRRTF